MPDYLVHYECPDGHNGIFTERRYFLKPKCTVCGKRTVEKKELVT